MARPLRIEYPGALYHIISRGNDKRDIFMNDKDRRLFLSTLRECVQNHNWLCHCYCLMSNHYHLLIETTDGNLSDGMRDLNGIYTQRFNKRHGRVGHLLQGRYKAFLIEKESYLLDVVRYIFLNPVKDKLIQRPSEWPWSSYAATVGLRKPPDFLHIDWILNCFSKDRRKSHRAIREFVSDYKSSNFRYSKLAKKGILGSEQFIYQIWEKMNGVEDKKEYPRRERIIGRPTLSDIFSGIKNKNERNKAILFARFRCGYLSTEIARFLKLDRSTIGKICLNK